MPDGWEWDATLFAGAAAHYERGRLPYAPGFAETVAAALGLDGRGRLLDVGCGPGTVLLALAGWFTEAVGLDPDAEMLAEAERQAVRRGVGNARWVEARAEELPAGLGEFRVATFGNSFHWMEQDRVAAAVLGMLAPGGAFVHLAEVHGRPADTSPSAPPHAEIAALVRRYLGPVRRAGRGTLPNGTPDGEEAVLAAAGFAPMERHVAPGGDKIVRSTDDVVSYVFSLSGSAPHLFGDRLAEFEHDLRELLAGRRFTERVPPSEIRIWRKPG